MNLLKRVGCLTLDFCKDRLRTTQAEERLINNIQISSFLVERSSDWKNQLGKVVVQSQVRLHLKLEDTKNTENQHLYIAIKHGETLNNLAIDLSKEAVKDMNNHEKAAFMAKIFQS